MSFKEDLPESWCSIQLGDVIDYGKTDKVEPKDISSNSWIVELEDIEKDTSRILQRLSFAERQSKSTKNRFDTGDVLYGKLRPYLNKVIIADGKGFCSTEIIPLKPNQAIDGRFLFYWLKHPEFLDYVTSVSHGLNMPRLGTEAGMQAPARLAPLNEQKRIADKLVILLKRVDACRERLERLPLILKRFRQAVLAAATSGALTEGWREENNLELGKWIQVKLQDLVLASANGLSKRRGDTGTQTVVLRLADFKNAERVLGNERLIKLDDKELIKYQLSDNDILVVRVNGSKEIAGRFISYNRSGVAPEAYCDHFIRLQLDPMRIMPMFALFVANSGAGRTFIESQLVTSAGQNTINQTSLFSLAINLPPMQEQKEIVRRVEKLFAFADKLETRYTTARKQVEQLTPALLAKAFRGELVEQDPNDEPAAVLLERIRAERAGQVKSPRRTVTRRAKG